MSRKFVNKDISKILRILRKEYKNWDVPIVTFMAVSTGSPFKVLISTILSLRTKDETTAEACHRLFSKAETPKDMLKLKAGEIEKLIYPVGFYRVKARNIKSVCKRLVNKYDSKVPEDLDELLKFEGVGRKTANLVITMGFAKPGICVDIHVHRISNRLGYISTQTPLQTEMVLREKLPRKYWIEYNSILVSFGQKLCRPVSPFCSKCPVIKYCLRVGVRRNR
ncbi:MAG: endonuclease III [Candidatus Dadabacteria bacterium]|nr:endonuclease III [Candidatus Dadabacteria bacterium]NIQ13667.1 endonuclease III [Candidatus Dadabacteria bacterium]